ncbi:MAG: hypothetical protein K2I90_06725, partial [Odoribacter sp.]|nr:hypothetical protein [Odoribacter sp.]
ARRRNGETQMFITTLVPSARYPNKEEDVKNFRYLGGGNFTGKVFCSTLEGHFVEASQYVKGRFISLLEVTTRKKLAENKESLDSLSYESVRLASAIKTRSGTYSFNEEGEVYCPDHPQYKVGDCPFCLDEVLVLACQYCGKGLKEGEVCACRKKCSYCNQYTCICASKCPFCRPFPCVICTICGRHLCFGECEDLEDENEDKNKDKDKDGGDNTGNGEKNPGNETGENNLPKDTIDNAPISAGNFVQKVITEEFKSAVNKELGVNPDEIQIIVNSNFKHSPAANAAYKDTDQTLHVYEEMFGRNLTLSDMEAIMYHEYVHAKQDIVDKIVYERDEKEDIVTTEYQIPYTEADVADAWNNLYGTLDAENIPRDKNQRSPAQEQLYQHYKELHVDPIEKAYNNGETKIEKYNETLIRSEIEAYQRQLDKYQTQMSGWLLEMTRKNLETNKNILNLIKNL